MGSSWLGESEWLDDGWACDEKVDLSAEPLAHEGKAERAEPHGWAIGAQRNAVAVAAGSAARRAALRAAHRVAVHTGRMAVGSAEYEAAEEPMSPTPVRGQSATWLRVDAAHAVESQPTDVAPAPGRRAIPSKWFVAGGLLVVVVACLVARPALSGEETVVVRAKSLDSLALAPSEPARARPTFVTSTVFEAPAAATVSASSQTFAMHFADAKTAAQEGRVEDALDAIDRALLISRGSRALVFKAKLLLDMEELSWALEIATEAVYTPPERATAWLTKGLVHYELDHAERARFALERYLDLAPGGGHARRARQILDSLRSIASAPAGGA